MTRRLTTALLTAALALLAMAGDARANLLSASATNCGSPQIEQPFLPFGDAANYFLVTGGAFEWPGGIAPKGWSLRGGATVVTDPTTLNLRTGGHDDVKALVLPAGAQAVTPTVCVGLEDPSMRYLFRSLGDRGSLIVSVQFWGPLNIPLELPIDWVGPSRKSWSPSSKALIIANLLTLLGRDKTPVAFRFRTSSTSGAKFAVDEIFVDPYRKG